MPQSRSLSLIALLAALTACADQSTAPTGLVSAGPPAAAKPGGTSDPTATFTFPNSGFALRGDGLYLSGGNSVYANGVCGVTATIFATTAGSNSGDARLQTDIPSASDRKCAAYPRKLTLDYGNGTDVGTLVVNVRAMQNTNFSIPVGTTARRLLVVNNTARCGAVKFGEAGDSANVTRISASEWHIQSQPYPNDNASCTTEGSLYHMQVDFTVVSSRPL
jgi:hypothetical protein